MPDNAASFRADVPAMHLTKPIACWLRLCGSQSAAPPG
jgi:hypothetical protein